MVANFLPKKRLRIFMNFQILLERYAMILPGEIIGSTNSLSNGIVSLEKARPIKLWQSPGLLRF